jgi:UDP-3-O-acyl N-acetylglucosamine deacetylase
MKLQQLSQRRQRTLAKPATIAGMGFLTGAHVRLRFVPAPPDTGIWFLRTDLRPPVSLPARLEHVIGTARRTTLGNATAQVALVEHVLAALAGSRIDNCVVELDAAEPPGLDGSARGFVEAIREAGAVLQQAWRPICGVRELVAVGAEGASLALAPGPADLLRVSYFLDYGPHSPIARQSCTERITPETFAANLASCRTFLLESEARELRRQGYGPGVTTADLLVIGPHGPINNRFRRGDEMARHKVLDIVGDLSLLGADLCGHLVACRSGHPLNIAMLRALTGSAVQPTRRAA